MPPTAHDLPPLAQEMRAEAQLLNHMAKLIELAEVEATVRAICGAAQDLSMAIDVTRTWTRSYRRISSDLTRTLEAADQLLIQMVNPRARVFRRNELFVERAVVPPSAVRQEEPPTALLIDFESPVEQPSESVCAATTPSLRPYKPSARVAPSAPPTSPEAPRDVLLAPIIAVAEQLSKLVLTDDDGDKEKEEIPKEEIPGEDIPKEEKPKSTGAIPKEKTGGAKGRSKRPPSIATSDEEYVPAGLNGNQPPLRHGTVAERLAATGTHPRAAQTISGPPEIVVGEAGYSPPSTPPSLGHWQGLEVGGAKGSAWLLLPLEEDDARRGSSIGPGSGGRRRDQEGAREEEPFSSRQPEDRGVGTDTRRLGGKANRLGRRGGRGITTRRGESGRRRGRRRHHQRLSDQSSVPRGREGGLRAPLPLAAARGLWSRERQVHPTRDLRSDPAV
jgi:hypothetical protein